jgi:hypothetical protein
MSRASLCGCGYLPPYTLATFPTLAATSLPDPIPDRTVTLAGQWPLLDTLNSSNPLPGKQRAKKGVGEVTSLVPRGVKRHSDGGSVLRLGERGERVRDGEPHPHPTPRCSCYDSS